jgi:hypothetical protein
MAEILPSIYLYISLLGLAIAQTVAGFPFQFSFHVVLHNHHQHPELVQWATWWPMCQVDCLTPHHK